MYHKYQPALGWWACNIKDVGEYIHRMREQVAPEELTPERLKQAIEEDSYGTIRLSDCEALLRYFPS